jgi:hypothetical protein
MDAIAKAPVGKSFAMGLKLVSPSALLKEKHFGNIVIKTQQV